MVSELSQAFQEIGYCPHCERALENFSKEEGGWCPDCEEWFPYDLVKEAMEDDEDRYPWEYVVDEDEERC